MVAKSQTRLSDFTFTLCFSYKFAVESRGQDRRVMVERSDRMWSTGQGNGKPLQYSCLENPMNSIKRQNDRTLKDELPRSVGVQLLLEVSGEITPDRMKRWSQSKSNAQLCV